MPEIGGLNRSMTLQPTTNVEELLNSQKTDDAQKTEAPSDVGKTDKTGAKAELEEVVHDDTALNGQTAENFVKNNKVEAGEDKKTEESDKADKTEKKDGADKTDKAEGDKKTDGEKKTDGDIKIWFDKHPRFKLAMMILEQILDTVINVMAGVSSKLPAGVGGCVTGGLSIIKGLAGFHKLESWEKDADKAFKEISKGGSKLAEGIAATIPDPTTPDANTPNGTDAANGTGNAAPLCLAAQLINCVGSMCGELSGAKSWEDALNAVGKSAADIVSAANPKSAEIADAVKTNMGNFTNAISRGVTEIKTAIKESDATNDEKTMNALEMFKKTLSEDATLSEDEKNLVKVLSDGAIQSIKAKGSKKTLDAYEETLGATASAILKGRNKEIAEQTLALMKDVRAEKDPFKAALLVLDKAKVIAGGGSTEIDKLKGAVADAGETAEKAGTTVDESSVQKDVGGFQDRLANLKKLMGA